MQETARSLLINWVIYHRKKVVKSVVKSTFRALALCQSESMDCWLSMAHTSDTSNGGATIIILVFHVSVFCVPTSSTASPFDIQYWLRTPCLSPERQLFISLRLIKFLISRELARICQCFTLPAEKCPESTKMCCGFKSGRGIVLDGFLEHWLFPS